jgi:hypothetical protein
MTLEKYLKRGQSSLEYFLLFGVTIAVTLVTVSAFLPSVKNSLQGNTTRSSLFEKAASGLGMAGGNVTFTTPPDEGTGGSGGGGGSGGRDRDTCRAECRRIRDPGEQLHCYEDCYR